VRLAPGTTTANIKTQIAGLFAKYNKPNYKDPETRTFELEPLSAIHFKGFYDSDSPGLADKEILHGLLAVAAFLLLLACINFINLTTAQASQRSKEIGIRKTMGGSKAQLILQFMGETFLLTVIATVIAALFTPILLKAFAAFIPEGVEFNIAARPGILGFLALLVILVSLLAGFYPAMMLSSGKIVLVLKNQAYARTAQSRNAWLRKGLTVTQFVIAQVFIIATLLVSKQINYSLNKNIGIRKDAIIYSVMYTDTSRAKKYVLVDKLKAIPGVEMASLSMDPPSSGSTWIDAMKFEDGKKQIQTDVQVKIGDSNYIRLYGIKLLAGANLVNNDTMGGLLINETYLHALGFTNPRDVVGKYVNVYGNKRIVGVVQDFNQKSLHETITPLLITGGIMSEYTVNIALQPQNADGTAWQKTIGRIRQAWKEVYPDKDFNYTFLDESIAAYYTAEQHVSALLMWSTGLTIFISCLGLLGLIIYVSNLRTKEIGIRKVIGASVTQLVSLLSKDLLSLVLIAFLIAVPIAWYAANAWLQNFAYRTALSWWIFLAGGAAMFAISLFILCARTIKAAMENPVKSLRAE
jgi:putative ABC transport system permease protein